MRFVKKQNLPENSRFAKLHKNHSLRNVFTGKKPTITKGTRAVVEMKQRRDFSPLRTPSSAGWEALFDRRIGHRIELLIRIPPHVPVGSWSVTVITWYGDKSLSESKHEMETHNAADPFYVLFNPFNESKHYIGQLGISG